MVRAVVTAEAGTVHPAVELGPGALPGMAATEVLETRVAAQSGHPQVQVRELVDRAPQRARTRPLPSCLLAGGSRRDQAGRRAGRQGRCEPRGDQRSGRADAGTVRRPGAQGEHRVSPKMDNGFTEMRGKLDAAAAGWQQIMILLTTLSIKEIWTFSFICVL